MKLLKIAGILAVACVLVVACVGAVSAEGETPDDTTTDNTPTGDNPEADGGEPNPQPTTVTITKITVGALVNSPTATTTCTVTLESSGTQISGVQTASVEWTPSNKTTAIVTVTLPTIENGVYQLATTPAIYSPDSTSSKSAELTDSNTKLKITLNGYTPVITPISSVTLTGIKSPVVGYKGSTTATVQTSLSGKVSVSEIKWYKGNDNWTNKEFTVGGSSNTYKVRITLSASSGYEFASPTTVTLSGWGTGGTLSASPTADSETTITVESTAVAASNVIDRLDISVTDPTTGANPVKTATVKGNTSITLSNASVKWMKTESNAEYTSAFKAGETYTAEITIPALASSSDYQYKSSKPDFYVNNKSCTGTGSGPYTVTYTPGATGKGKITVVNITNLKVPTIGDSPTSSSYTAATAKGKLTSSSSDISLSASVDWYFNSTKLTSSETFEANKIYKAKITVTFGSTTGYEFKTSSAISATVTDAAGASKTSSPTTTDESTLVVEHEFAETNGTISSITISLTEPALDGVPLTYATVTSVTPSASLSTTSPKVTWVPYHTKFAGGNTYDVTITLTAKDGFTFDSSPLVELSGTRLSSSEKSVESDKKTLTIRHTYPRVTSAINEVYLDVSRPVAGHKPSTAVKVSSTKPPIIGVTGTVVWSPSLTAEEEFEEHTVYTATVTLANSNSEYAFSSSTKVYVNGEPATVSRSGTQLKATYKFSETGEEGLISFGDVSIPYPTDFFHEFLELIKAFFNFGEWNLFE